MKQTEEYRMTIYCKNIYYVHEQCKCFEQSVASFQNATDSGIGMRRFRPRPRWDPRHRDPRPKRDRDVRHVRDNSEMRCFEFKTRPETEMLSSMSKIRPRSEKHRSEHFVQAETEKLVHLKTETTSLDWSNTCCKWIDDYEMVQQ